VETPFAFAKWWFASSRTDALFPIVFLTTFMVWFMQGVSAEIEKPFRSKCSNLDLRTTHHDMNQRLLALLRHSNQKHAVARLSKTAVLDPQLMQSSEDLHTLYIGDANSRHEEKHSSGIHRDASRTSEDHEATPQVAAEFTPERLHTEEVNMSCPSDISIDLVDPECSKSAEQSIGARAPLQPPSEQGAWSSNDQCLESREDVLTRTSSLNRPSQQPDSTQQYNAQDHTLLSLTSPNSVPSMCAQKGCHQRVQFRDPPNHSNEQSTTGSHTMSSFQKCHEEEPRHQILHSSQALMDSQCDGLTGEIEAF